MHAARTAARAGSRHAIARTPAASSSLLLNRSSNRSFGYAAPASDAATEKKPVRTDTAETLATRLKNKRAADTRPSGPAALAPQPDAIRDVGTSTSNQGPSVPSKPPAGPHKVRVPAGKPSGDAAGETPRKDRKRAPIEGFKAKRFAMLRLRREQAQAVAEAHGDGWLADEVSRVFAAWIIDCPGPALLAESAGPGGNMRSEDLTKRPVTQHKSPYELGAERYIRMQGHLPIKDQLRLYRARLSLLESLRQPWDKLGRQERQFEVAEYAKALRAREKQRRGGGAEGEMKGKGGDGSAAARGNSPSVQVIPLQDDGPTEHPPDFDDMVRTHSEPISDPTQPEAESPTPSTSQTAPERPKKKKVQSDKEVAAERAQTWPAELEQMDAAISQFKDCIADLTAKQSRDGTAPPPPPVRPRTGPSLLDQIAESVASNGVGRTRGRTPRGQAAARAAANGGIDYDNHPALAEGERVDPPPPRELSSYQHILSPASTAFTPFPSPYQVPVATLAHSLDRVLFNPGVHFLRDPRTGVYNFTRDTLENVPKISEFDFAKLPQYVTSSKDETLKEIAASQGKTFSGSTSSTVGMLCQIYFWLSKGKQVHLDMLSRGWQYMNRDFSMGQKLPVSVVLRYENGRYAIDADKSFDPTNGSNVLADYGHLMEKLLTNEAGEFRRFLHDAEDPAPSEADDRQAYHYSLTDRMVLRSQLDAINEHLPNKTFDLKTRGTVAIRQDRLNYEESAGYTIDRLQGEWESFEREYYDLIRSAFLKYQFQARIGGMDGIFVAYHSTTRFFGFQYLPISVMDEALFGTTETGEQVFRLALGTLELVLDEAIKCYPEQSVNVTWATDRETGVLRVFVAPQEQVEQVDSAAVEQGTGKEGASIEVSPDTAAAMDDAPATTTAEGTPEEVSPRLVEMTLLELRSTNYVDGEAQDHPVTIVADRGPPGSSLPTWQVGFDIVKSTGAEGDAVSREQIAALFAETRAFQRMFSSLALPTGISPADVQAAAERAQEAGVELDESDLSVRFPLGEGIEYRGPSKPVKILRRKAREGEERRKAEEKRRLEEGGGKEKIVEVKTYIEVREV
ncbi:hypothetical protein JCM10908_001022 [Rhodotorula pacifica]|uniref:Pet127p n=1 Tax=Rhodotorula pacifica TaxID=1495444 RepID=UPI00316CE59D